MPDTDCLFSKTSTISIINNGIAWLIKCFFFLPTNCLFEKMVVLSIVFYELLFLEITKWFRASTSPELEYSYSSTIF